MATPKIIPYEVQLRSTKIKRNISRPVVYTNDLNSAEFQFHVTDMEPGELSTATATTLIKAKDGSFFQGKKEDVGLVGTTFTYTLKENEGNHAGIATIQLIVYFDAGSPNEQNFPSQIYEFEIVNGLDSKVAQEIMIHDWTTLTREARAYIDQFVADEMLRDAEFDNAQFDRNTTFVASQDARTLAFGTEQTNRGTAFTAEQNERTTAFNESESGRTTAESGRVTAESNRVTAESGRVSKESQRVTAESSRVTAESGRVTAESGRVTAESGRVTAETNRAAALQELVAHKASTANPHGVTKTQVGLGNVDNTSDVNKPVSTAMQTALNLKANKAQEAWITPTLLNGWYAIRPEEPPQYMKDEFGFVHFRGVVAKTAGSQINVPFSLPTAYRPNVNTTFNLANIGALSFRSLAVTIYSSTGNVDFAGSIVGTETWYALSSINFKGA